MKKELTKYQQAKNNLKTAAKEIKQYHVNDKPAIRMYINDCCDSICKDNYFKLSDHKVELLHNYACTLHPA